MEPMERHLFTPDADRPGRRHPAAVIDAVHGAPLFAGVQPGQVATILDAFDEESFNAGHRILLEGLRGQDFFLIVSGRARVTVDGWRVAMLGPGEFFGEIGVLGDGRRSATVAAETPLRCLVLPNRGLQQLMIDHPVVGLNVLHEVVQRTGAGTGSAGPSAR